MVSGGTIAIGLGLAAGAGLIWYARKQAEAAAADSKCDAIVAAAVKAGVPEAVARAACNALPSIGDILEGVGSAIGTTSAEVKRWDAENKALNGEVATPISDFLRKTVTVYPSTTGADATRGTVLEFKNGCVPFAGAAGWSKCKQGTHDMRHRPNNYDPTAVPVGTGVEADDKQRRGKATSWTNFMTGSGDPSRIDPATQGPFRAGAVYGMYKTPFPLPLAEGELGWLWRGRPFKCAADRTPAWNVRDHTSDTAMPPCGPFGGGGPPPPIDQAGEGHTTEDKGDTSPTTCPPEFIWDANLFGPGVGGCRRRNSRAGE